MSSKSIGYVPISRDLSHPADRRRLIFWAKAREKKIEINDFSDCETIVFSETTDFQSIKKYKTKVKILDLVDAYLTPENHFQDITRGVLKHSIGNQSGWVKPFSYDVQNACKIVDVVICSSIEQAAVIRKYNSEVHVILDSHDEFQDIAFQQRDLMESEDDNVRFFWEGQAATLDNFRGIEKPLLSIMKNREFILEVITDERYFLIMNKFFSMQTTNKLKKLDSDLKNSIKYHSWSVSNVNTIARNSHIALLPLNVANHFQSLKPENRLHIMWRLGLPCLVSDIPSYSRVASQINQRFTCTSSEDWERKIRMLVNEPGMRLEQVEAGKKYLASFHSTEQLLKKWDRVLEDV